MAGEGGGRELPAAVGSPRWIESAMNTARCGRTSEISYLSFRWCSRRYPFSAQSELILFLTKKHRRHSTAAAVEYSGCAGSKRCSRSRFGCAQPLSSGHIIIR